MKLREICVVCLIASVSTGFNQRHTFSFWTHFLSGAAAQKVLFEIFIQRFNLPLYKKYYIKVCMCLSFCLSVPPAVRPSICLFVSLFTVRLCLFLSFHLSVFLCLSVRLPICPSVCLHRRGANTRKVSHTSNPNRQRTYRINFCCLSVCLTV